jgi:hypothetical protein
MRAPFFYALRWSYSLAVYAIALALVPFFLLGKHAIHEGLGGIATGIGAAIVCGVMLAFLPALPMTWYFRRKTAS